MRSYFEMENTNTHHNHQNYQPMQSISKFSNKNQTKNQYDCPIPKLIGSIVYYFVILGPLSTNLMP